MRRSTQLFLRDSNVRKQIWMPNPLRPFAHEYRSRASRLALCLLLLLACAFTGLAQTGTGGTMLGTVTDPSGAVVPNVGITITNTDTGQSRQVTTNDAGQYVVPDLQIGHYNVRAEASGF